MASRPSKKRSYEEPPKKNAAIVEVESSLAFPAASSSPASLPAFCLEQQIASLQVELEHERSLRALDRKRAQHAKERLEKQVELAVDEAHEATRALDDFKASSDKLTQQLRQSRNDALQELRQVQIARHDGVGDDSPDVDSMEGVWKQKCAHLEQVLATQKEREQELHHQLKSLRSEVHKKADERETLLANSPARQPKPAPTSEDAPPAVLRELNRVRIALAEAERRERQLQLKTEQQHKRVQSLVLQREEEQLAVQRLTALQDQHGTLQRDYETLKAQHEAWNAFGKALEGIMADHDEGEASPEKKRRRRSSGPPEVAALQRFLETAQLRVKTAQTQASSLQDQLKQVQGTVVPSLEKQLQEQSAAEQTALKDKRVAQSELQQAQQQVKLLQTQQSISQQEIANLQSLIQTLDDLPLVSSSSSSSKKGGAADNKPPAASQALEISLKSAKEQVASMQAENAKLSQAVQEGTAELERVKEKFGKLRDALHAERAKVEQAEQRANQAEELAGKGSFNPEMTQVLHLNETPLALALKEEIKVLKRQLEAAASSSSSSNPSKGSAAAAGAAADPTKLHQRLKENFKEHIALFREGVYLMTGYKVDMLPGSGGSADRPTFRVRSMFAEQEEDHLLLKWPKKTGDDKDDDEEAHQATSLDILNTNLAKSLTTTSSYEYMTKFHSLPAFLASVQLSLFEKQTVMM